MQEEVAENLSRVCVDLGKEKKKEKRRKTFNEKLFV